MPSIDVTSVLISLGIAAQEFSIIRRQEIVNQYGESVKTEVAIGPLVGAVQPIGERSLIREEVYSTGLNGITVWSQFPLNNVVRNAGNETYQPDLVYWKGDYYVVRMQEDWTQFGAGFTKVECIGFDYAQRGNY